MNTVTMTLLSVVNSYTALLDNSYQPAIITQKQNKTDVNYKMQFQCTQHKMIKKKIPSTWEARIWKLFQDNNREKPSTDSVFLYYFLLL